MKKCKLNNRFYFLNEEVRCADFYNEQSEDFHDHISYLDYVEYVLGRGWISIYGKVLFFDSFYKECENGDQLFLKIIKIENDYDYI